MALQREGVGIKMDSGLPHLVVLDDDLFSTGIVVYHLTVCYQLLCKSGFLVKCFSF